MSQDAKKPADDKHQVSMVEEPPVKIGGILRRLGPGLIIAGSIVGSGELIATTATGAQAGFYLLWLIIIGCVIKVFVQVELGRYAIANGKTTMSGMNEVPGPRLQLSRAGHLKGNWLLFYWIVVFIVSLGQLGGIVGGVGQALAISLPLTKSGRQFNEQVDALTKLVIDKHEHYEHDKKFVGRLDEEKREYESLVVRLKAEPQAAPLVESIQQQQMDELRGRFDSIWLYVEQLRGDAATENAANQIEEERLEPLLLEAAPFPTLTKQFAGDPRSVPVVARIKQRARPRFDDVQRLQLQIKYYKSLVNRIKGESWAAGYLNQLDQSASQKIERLNRQIKAHEVKIAATKNRFKDKTWLENVSNPEWWSWMMTDDKWWALIVTIATSLLLVVGRYNLIQTLCTVLVASFTLITIVNLFALQMNGTYAVTWDELASGLSFRLTPSSEALGLSPLATALATFGIIGVGGNELVVYPYWCLEKGYARFTGPRDDSEAWARRARGWMRVMRWDAWCSMVVYTFATIAFFLLGAAILHKLRLTPKGTEMIRTLAVMYEPVFGSWTSILFLFGAFAVLYSTFFVANASHARVFPDALREFGIGSKDDKSYRSRIRLFSGIFPFLCLIIYIFFPHPTTLVLASGVMQALLLPMMAFAALYFRYRRCDPRIMPGRVWDILLWISVIGLFATGVCLVLTKFVPL